jgi:hypothetical protein
MDIKCASICRNTAMIFAVMQIACLSSDHLQRDNSSLTTLFTFSEVYCPNAIKTTLELPFVYDEALEACVDDENIHLVVGYIQDVGSIVRKVDLTCEFEKDTGTMVKASSFVTEEPYYGRYGSKMFPSILLTSLTNYQERRDCKKALKELLTSL